MKDTNNKLLKEIFDVGLYNKTIICHKACTSSSSVNQGSINETKAMLLYTVLTDINKKVIASVKESTEESLALLLNTELISVRFLYKDTPSSYYQNLHKWRSGKEELNETTLIHAFVVLREASAIVARKLKKIKISKQKIITITLNK